MRAESAHLLTRFSQSIPHRQPRNRAISAQRNVSRIFHDVVVSTPNLNLPYNALRRVEPQECYNRQYTDVECFHKRVYRANSVPVKCNQFPLKAPNFKLAREGIIAENAYVRQNFRRKANYCAVQTDFTPAVDIISFTNLRRNELYLVDSRRDIGSKDYAFRCNPYKITYLLQTPKVVRRSPQSQLGYLRHFIGIARSSSESKKARFFRECNESADAHIAKYVGLASRVSAFGADENKYEAQLLAKHCNWTALQAYNQATDAFLEEKAKTNKLADEMHYEALERSFLEEKTSVKHLITSIAEKESQMLFAKFISTNKKSRFYAADEMQIYLYQYFDITLYKDFGSIGNLNMHSNMDKSHQQLAVNYSIMTNLQQHMFWGVIYKQLRLTESYQFDLFSYCWTCPLQQLFYRLKIKSVDYLVFYNITYMQLFQLLNYIVLSRDFFSAAQLVDSAPAFSAAAALSAMNANVFRQCETQASGIPKFSSYLLDCLILHCMRSLGACYYTYALNNVYKVINSSFQIIGEELTRYANIYTRPTIDFTAFSLLDVVTENMCRYSFYKADYIYNNYFLTYYSDYISPYITDAAHTYYRHHFYHFFNASQSEVRDYSKAQLVPRIQIATMLLANVAKGYLLAESTYHVVQSAFYGVTPRASLAFCYTYYALISLLLIMLTNEFANQYLRSEPEAKQELLLAKYSTFCSMLLNEVLLINFMFLGNDYFVYCDCEGDVSRMFNQKRKNYGAYVSLGVDADIYIAKNFAYYAIQFLWIYADANELCSYRLIGVLTYNDILAGKAADFSSNKQFLAVYDKYKTRIRPARGLQE